jgi:hypothetical protein
MEHAVIFPKVRIIGATRPMEKSQTRSKKLFLKTKTKGVKMRQPKKIVKKMAVRKKCPKNIYGRRHFPFDNSPNNHRLSTKNLGVAMPIRLEDLNKRVEKERLKKINKTLERLKSLKPNRHDRKMVEVKEPLVCHGRATTTKAKITRNKLAQLTDYDSKDSFYRFCRKISMKLTPKKSKK